MPTASPEGSDKAAWPVLVRVTAGWSTLSTVKTTDPPGVTQPVLTTRGATIAVNVIGCPCWERDLKHLKLSY